MGFGRQRRRVLAALIGLASVPLWGCAPPPALAVGIHPWPGYEPLYLAEHFVWLPPNVALSHGFSASNSLHKLRTGAIDCAALTLDEVLSARAEGIPLTIIFVLNISVGADVVLARPDITELGQLVGRRIAVETSAVGGIVLAKLLEAAELTMADVEILDIPHDAQLAAWLEGQIDAVISFAPTDALIERAGAQRIFDSRAFPGTIFDVLAIRQDKLRTHRRSLQALIRAHLLGLEHIRVYREDAMRRIAAWRGLTVAEAERGFSGLDLPRVAANRAYLAEHSELWHAAAMLNEIMTFKGWLPKPDSLLNLTDAGYLPREDVIL